MQQYFQLDDDVIYLNHAAVAPWPVATADAVNNFATENARTGAKYYPDWLKLETQLRDRLKQLINAPSSDDIALLKSTSEGLSFIAHGLEWKPGDNIVIPAEEFPSNRIVWQSLQTQGVEVRRIAVEHASDPEQTLLDATDDNTRLISVSAVQYASGFRLRLELLGTYCRKHNILFCVDAIQQLGALEFDAQAVNADFVVADGHKWMLGPEGLALFYCREALRDQLKLFEYGWRMIEDHFNFEQIEWRPASSARRFECGSPNMLGVVALNASLGIIAEVGMNNIEARNLQNSAYLIEQLTCIDGIELITPTTADRYAGIVTFGRTGIDPVALHAYLDAHGVVCAVRGGGVRFSPHFYISEAQLDGALALVRKHPK